MYRYPTPAVRPCQLILAVAMAAGLASCADDIGPVIGIAMGGIDQALLPARQKRFNDSVGTRHTVQLRLMLPNTYAEDNGGLAWANELVTTPGIVGVVGHESSRLALQAAPIYRQRGIVQIVPTGTSSQLATVSPWTFPLVASDTMQGQLLARHLLDRKRTRITLFVQDDEYGRGIAGALERGLAGSNAVVLEKVSNTPDSDFDLLVRSVLSHVPAPDALVLITQGPLAASIAELSWKRDPTLLILGADATSTGASALRLLAPAPDLAVLATYWVPDTTNVAEQAFLRDFRESEIGGEPQWYHAAMYDAVGMLNAAAASEGNSPTGVRAWLRSLGRTRPSYQGVLGSIDFTGAHPIPARLVRPTATGWELVK